MGTPTYIPQNDPHDPHALIILNIHNWGKKNFQKKNCQLAQAHISQGPTWRLGRGQIYSVFFLTKF